MRELALIVCGIGVLTLVASYAMTRASNRSAMWNMGVAGIAVVVLMLILAFGAWALTDLAFGGF